MAATNILCLSGLSGAFLERAHSIKRDDLAPNGHVEIVPLQGARYSPVDTEILVHKIHRYLLKLRENEPVRIMILAPDFGDEATVNFLNSFFPYASVRSFQLPDVSLGPNALRMALNKFEKAILREAKALRNIVNVVSFETDRTNKTPLLLPIRNFVGRGLRELIDDLYSKLPRSDDPQGLIGSAIKKFLATHPAVKPPSSPKPCFSDGALYFKSPGSDRHGYYRHLSQNAHDPSCLLAARSRLGGNYKFDFHFDCEPVKGNLKRAYPNCHNGNVRPQKSYLNIAPSDYII